VGVPGLDERRRRVGDGNSHAEHDGDEQIGHAGLSVRPTERVWAQRPRPDVPRAAAVPSLAARQRP
jgi:hypothetical protein